MSNVIYDISMSLDGFVIAGGATAEEPLGKGGERLHEWAMGGDPASRKLLEEAVDSAGAFICGRRTYDTSMPGWDADGPTGDARLPVFVVTHQSPDDSPEDGVYTFVTDGLESAVRQASEVAGDKNIALMGGPDVASQFVKAGLVDQIGIHLVPVLFGGGERLVDLLGADHLQLEVDSVLDTPTATHLRYRIMK
ncbi:MAG TPA: dihydrofolate reductase family protein [Nocardioidaceae bacterium]|nr:dihydrofolate reductase family protein [Nocardioidaceae bacterium]